MGRTTREFKVGIVRGVRRCTADGQAVLTLNLFRQRAGCPQAEWPAEFLWIDVHHGPGEDVPHEVSFGRATTGLEDRTQACYTGGADSPTGTRCIPVDGTLILQSVDAGGGVTGRIEARLPTGEIASGEFSASWCGGVYEVEDCPRGGTSTDPP